MVHLPTCLCLVQHGSHTGTLVHTPMCSQEDSRCIHGRSCPHGAVTGTHRRCSLLPVLSYSRLPPSLKSFVHSQQSVCSQTCPVRAGRCVPTLALWCLPSGGMKRTVRARTSPPVPATPAVRCDLGAPDPASLADGMSGHRSRQGGPTVPYTLTPWKKCSQQHLDHIRVLGGCALQWDSGGSEQSPSLGVSSRRLWPG